MREPLSRPQELSGQPYCSKPRRRHRGAWDLEVAAAAGAGLAAGSIRAARAARRQGTSASADHRPCDASESWQLRGQWAEELREEVSSESFQKLRAFVDSERAAGKPIYPPPRDVFRSLELCDLPDVKVVILGQDPYHQRGQANGLSFSVRRGMPVPPSLRNIFKELSTDLELPAAKHGDLTSWAEQGVLLLNSLLTVEHGQPMSHAKHGWETFTGSVIRLVNEHRSGVVFMLWGRVAEARGAAVDTERHHVLTAAHPSPMSAFRGFLGCRHFSRANALIEGQGQAPIDWDLRRSWQRRGPR